MSSKLFTDMNVIDRKNKFDQQILNRSINALRKQDLIDGKTPSESRPEKESVNAEVNEAVSLIGSLISLHRNLLTARDISTASGLLRLVVDIELKYNRLNSILEDLSENKIFNLTGKNIQKISRKFDLLTDGINDLGKFIETVVVDDDMTNEEFAKIAALGELIDRFNESEDFIKLLDSRAEAISSTELAGNGMKVPRKFL
jgi:hypothetical protein